MRDTTQILILLLSGLCGIYGAHPAGAVASELPQSNPATTAPIELGRHMYLDGVLPSNESMTGYVEGDVRLSGEQVICATCHRRSGMGSSEGQTVIPAVVGELLFNPLRLPTSKPPLAPVQRPAYTEASLKRAIREGIGADGQRLGPLMPRYPLSDADLDRMIAYLKSLSLAADPGVTDREIHFATVVADSVDPVTRKAFTDVLVAFFTQKNAETRHEGQRAAKAPWHKKVVFGPYRKWVLHVWELKGPRASWPEQLASRYLEYPVFAVLSGIAPGSWRPIHDFCEQNKLPCLFPITDLPVDDESDFYSVYLSKGMALEGEAIAQHLMDDAPGEETVLQVLRKGDPKGEVAAEALHTSLGKRGRQVEDFLVDPPGDSSEVFWQSVREAAEGASLVLWLGASDLPTVWSVLSEGPIPQRIYTSGTLCASDFQAPPTGLRDRVYIVYPYELPNRQNRLLTRSTGWLRVKRIYAPQHKRVQADAFFALKMAGSALDRLHGYFLRDYFLERIEHMVDYASYTSVYPRISLAPGQRFLSKGAYIVRFLPEGAGDLAKVTDWLIPGSK